MSARRMHRHADGCVPDLEAEPGRDALNRMAAREEVVRAGDRTTKPATPDLGRDTLRRDQRSDRRPGLPPRRRHPLGHGRYRRARRAAVTGEGRMVATSLLEAGAPIAPGRSRSASLRGSAPAGWARHVRSTRAARRSERERADQPRHRQPERRRAPRPFGADRVTASRVETLALPAKAGTMPGDVLSRTLHTAVRLSRSVEPTEGTRA
jgi:hypothetical protein